MSKTIKYIFLFIFVLIAIWLGIPFIKGLTSTLSPKKSIEMAKQSTNNNSGNFEIVDGIYYKFYYPKGFINKSTGNIGNIDLVYENPDSKAVLGEGEKLMVFIIPTDKTLTLPTIDSCKTWASNKGELSVINDISQKGIGCLDITTSSDGFTIITKTIWNQGEKRVYSLRAEYSNNDTRKEVVQNIEEAINLFTLK